MILAADSTHLDEIVAAVEQVEGTEVLHLSDRTFLLHAGGKIEVVAKTPLRTRDDLSRAYTPGVARVSQAIADDPELVWTLTTKGNMVAVVTDGSAVLGSRRHRARGGAARDGRQGDAVQGVRRRGCLPDLPRHSGRRRDRRHRSALAPGFGGINLEDIAAPRCFEIEERLNRELEIPVFHDDQHGTAIVVLAALTNALRVVGKRLEEIKIVTTGVELPGRP